MILVSNFYTNPPSLHPLSAVKFGKFNRIDILASYQVEIIHLCLIIDLLDNHILSINSFLIS